MKPYIIILLAIISLAKANAQAVLPEAKSVGEIDLKKFSGAWFEISRLPNPVDSDLRNVCIHYTKRSGNKMREVLDGTTANNKSVKLKSKLEYLGKGEIKGPLDARYIVLAVGAKYEYMMMGTPDHKYLWIMSRKKTLDNNTYNSLISKADKMGYAILLMQMTKQE